MKNEFKLLVKRDRNGSYEVIEYSESKDVLIERQKQLKQEQPAWEILVVKQNYNVSWKEKHYGTESTLREYDHQLQYLGYTHICGRASFLICIFTLIRINIKKEDIQPNKYKSPCRYIDGKLKGQQYQYTV